MKISTYSHAESLFQRPATLALLFQYAVSNFKTTSAFMTRSDKNSLSVYLLELEYEQRSYLLTTFTMQEHDSSEYLLLATHLYSPASSGLTSVMTIS